jgi:hypothetical protein
MAIGPINFKDPRFQEAMLKAGAGGPRNQLGLAQGITDRFTTNQAQQLLSFQELANQRRGFEANLGLAERRLKFNNKAFKKGLSDRRRESNLATGTGLFTAGLGFLEGRRRSKLLKEDAATIERRHQELLSAYRGKK